MEYSSLQSAFKMLRIILVTIMITSSFSWSIPVPTVAIKAGGGISPSSSHVGNDLQTSETFWNVLGVGLGTGTRGYSGWGTAPYPSGYGGAYGSYAPVYGTGYGAYGTSNYYGGTGGNYAGLYQQSRPTYENYQLHGGHGFGPYGNY